MNTKYKVWHIPQVPGKAFEFFTNDLNVADEVREQLALYDLFQLENNIKGDYANVNGIQEWDEEEGEYWDMDEYEIDSALGRL